MNWDQPGRNGARFAIVVVIMGLAAFLVALMLPRPIEGIIMYTALAVDFVAILIGLTIDFVLPRLRRQR